MVDAGDTVFGCGGCQDDEAALCCVGVLGVGTATSYGDLERCSGVDKALSKVVLTCCCRVVKGSVGSR